MSDSAPDSEGETITLHELLERSARAALDLQREDGSFPPGRNGVYDESETPVRTTSHWLTTLSKVYDITGDEVFADAAHDAADYLLSDEARPYGYTFHSRSVKGKDKCDGLVGQAAPIRGLAWAGTTLNRQEALTVAKEVFSIHPFDRTLGLWKRVEIGGDELFFDRTMNHQLLFAGAAAHLVDEYQDIQRDIKTFFECLSPNISLRRDGVMRHYVRPPLSRIVRTIPSCPANGKLLTNNFLSRVYTLSSDRKEKERGYHPVNLLGIAHILINMPELLSEHTQINGLINAVLSESLLSDHDWSEFRMGAMTPSIDIALAKHALADATMSTIRQLVNTDIYKKYNTKSSFLENDTTDPVFQAATLSYAVDLPNQSISIRE